MMKKITLMMTLFLGFALNAQTLYFEDFETQTAATAPTGFTVLNEDACTINDPASFVNSSWTVADMGDAQGLVASAQSWVTVTTCQVDKWLITPQIDLTTGATGTQLTWLAQSWEGPNFPENYEVLLSTTGTAVADFTVNLLTVIEEADVWTEQTVDLTPYLASNVYIAFRLISTDESRLLIDEIKVASPPPYKNELGAFSITDGSINSVSGLIPSLVVDFSKRTNVEFNVDVVNLGTLATDTVIVKTELSSGATGLVILSVEDTVVTTIAPGATYTYTLAPQDLTALFPALGSNEPILIDFTLGSTIYNPEVVAADSIFTFLIATTESYGVPYSNSFEIRSGGNATFDHATYSWKYLDNDNDGNTFGSYAFTNVAAQDGDHTVIGSIVNGATISISATDETLQSPELTLVNGSAYEFSIYASTFLGQTGSFSMVLTDGTGSLNTTLGAINLALADSFLEKYTFQTIAPASQEDFLINLNKEAAGLVLFDLFEIVEIFQPTTAPTVSNVWDVCDKEATLTVDFVEGNTYTVDWGDGAGFVALTTPVTTHIYGTAGTTYNVQVIAENILGTSPTATSVVNAIDLPTPDATFTFSQSSPGSANVSFSALQGITCYTYAWNFGDFTSGASPNETHTYTTNDTFTVSLFIQDPVSLVNNTTTKEVVVTGIEDPTISINEINFVNGIKVFPNPVNDVLNISFELNSVQNVEISLHSIDGKVVNTISNTSSNVSEVINTSKLAAGIYILDITTDTGKYTTNVVVK